MKARSQLIDTIRRDEDRARSVKQSLARQNVRKQSQIALDNQRIAVKLFTQRPTFEVMKME